MLRENTSTWGQVLLTTWPALSLSRSMLTSVHNMHCTIRSTIGKYTACLYCSIQVHNYIASFGFCYSLRFHPQTQNLKLPCTALQTVLERKYCSIALISTVSFWYLTLEPNNIQYSLGLFHRLFQFVLHLLCFFLNILIGLVHFLVI